MHSRRNGTAADCSSDASVMARAGGGGVADTLNFGRAGPTPTQPGLR